MLTVVAEARLESCLTSSMLLHPKAALCLLDGPVQAIGEEAT